MLDLADVVVVGPTWQVARQRRPFRRPSRRGGPTCIDVGEGTRSVAQELVVRGWRGSESSSNFIGVRMLKASSRMQQHHRQHQREETVAEEGTPTRALSEGCHRRPGRRQKSPRPSPQR